MSKRLGENLYKNQEIEVLEKSIKRKMDRVNEGKSVDSYQHLMIYLETEQPGW